MTKTGWRELDKLQDGKYFWFRRRVRGYTDSCSGCGNKKKDSLSSFEYSCVEEAGVNPDSGWDGKTYCGIRCLPEEMLLRYRLSNRRYKNPRYGDVKARNKAACEDRLGRLAGRFEEMKRAKGAVTIISREEGISRQRVYQLLERFYGKGNVGCGSDPTAPPIQL